MIQFNKNSIKISTLFIAIFSFATPQKSLAQTAKWTDIYTTTNANFYDIQKSYEKQEKKWERAERKSRRKGEEIKENGGEEVYKRWESFMAPRVYPSGNLSLPSSNYTNFLQWQKQNPLTQVQKKTRAMPSLLLTLSSNKPSPIARVCGMPRLPPNS